MGETQPLTLIDPSLAPPNPNSPVWYTRITDTELPQDMRRNTEHFRMRAHAAVYRANVCRLGPEDVLETFDRSRCISGDSVYILDGVVCVAAQEQGAPGVDGWYMHSGRIWLPLPATVDVKVSTLLNDTLLPSTDSVESVNARIEAIIAAIDAQKQ